MTSLKDPPIARTADLIAPVVQRFLDEHAERQALAVVLAYDEEASAPTMPRLGIIWRDEYERLSKKGWALEDLLNPAEYESFDSASLSLRQAKALGLAPSLASQRQFYLEVARALSARLGAAHGVQQQELVVYATDLECNHLGENLEALGIKSIGGR